MKTMTLFEKVKELGFKDRMLIDALILQMTNKFPDRELDSRARRGNYSVPLRDGKLTTDASPTEYRKNAQGNYDIVQFNMGRTRNLTFFDVLRVHSVGDCRLFADSLRFDTPMQIHMDSADAVLIRLINGHIGGFWTFKKHGRDMYYLTYLGEEEPEDA